MDLRCLYDTGLVRVYHEVVTPVSSSFVFFFQAEDGIRYAQESRVLGDGYKRQVLMRLKLLKDIH